MLASKLTNTLSELKTFLALKIFGHLILRLQSDKTNVCSEMRGKEVFIVICLETGDFEYGREGGGRYKGVVSSISD